MEEGALAARATRPTAPQTSVVSQVLTNMSSGEAVTEAVATETAENQLIPAGASQSTSTSTSTVLASTSVTSTPSMAASAVSSSPSVSAQKGQEELEVGVFYLLAACVYLC